MYLLKTELKKLISMPMLWVFLLICLVLNFGIIFVNQYKLVDASYFSYVGDTASVTGKVLGKEFSKKLSAMPDSANKSRLTSETQNATEVYADYDAAALADAYIGLYEISGAGAELLSEKYGKLQTAVQKLDQAGAEFSLYSAGTTVQMHQLLFGTVFRAMITESCILAVLVMLYLCTYEYQNKTELMVYATKTGRGIYKYKFCSGIMISVFYFVLIAFVTLVVYFSVFDYSGIWGSSVSSGFNFISDMIGVKPFITWIPFTVKGYLAVMLGLGLGLTLVFAMMGAFIGFAVRNSYVGTMLFFLLAMAMMTVPYIFSKAGIWSWYFLLQLTPVRIWFVIPEWLTDLGSVSVMPYHETVGIILNLLVWGSLVFGAYQYVKRKDVA